MRNSFGIQIEREKVHTIIAIRILGVSIEFSFEHYSGQDNQTCYWKYLENARGVKIQLRKLAIVMGIH